MKHLVLILFALLPFYLFGQQKPIKHGFITLTTSQKIEFNNLRFVDDKVVFQNVATKSEFTYFLNTVKIIEDESKNIVYVNNASPKLAGENSQTQAETIVKTPVDESKKLKFVNTEKITMNGKKLRGKEIKSILEVDPQNFELYKSGSTNATIGNMSLGIGLGLIIWGGMTNLRSANTTSNNSFVEEKKGSPVPIIIGLGLGVVSMPFKIAGRRNMRESISRHNRNNVVYESKIRPGIIADNDGVGLSISW
ncbi:MAG TPA: hypothetical protein VGB43_01300 [Flavobacterium sp.]